MLDGSVTKPQRMKRIVSALRVVGIDLPRLSGAVPRLARFGADLRNFRGLQYRSQSRMGFGKLYPCIEDYDAESGVATGHYFHQDLLVAQRIFAAKPLRHVDVASRVNGFVAHVAVFREIEVFDIRHLTTSTKNVIFHQCDVTADIDAQYVNYCDSLSCLHALEHFGLGRYGDKLDPDGHLKGLDNLRRILRGGGILYLAVPIGPHRIEFNAHRVFGVPELLRILSERFAIERFSYVDDVGDLHDNVSPTGDGSDRHFGCQYGLGIFELRKT